jgi:excisionase family DNA binding protein
MSASRIGDNSRGAHELSKFAEDCAMSQLLTIKQAAERLACSEAAIRKWISQGRLTRVKLGRLTRLRLEDVERMVSAGALPGRSCGKQAA